MTSSRVADVRGAQRPRVELCPTAAYSDLAEDTIALCAAVGLNLDPWQEHVVRGMLGERLDGKFVAPRVGIVVPRQQGKGVILEARALAGLFLLKEPFIIWTAHELKTAQAAFLRLRGWIDAAPDLAKHVRQYYTGNTENSIVLNDGRTLRFLARTAGSGRGLTGSTLILDEAYALKDNQLAALSPVLTTAKNPQTIYTSSAGMPDSEVLERIREQGMDPSTTGLAYFEWSAPDDAELDDMSALAQANPGLGTRLSLERVAEERADWTDEVFRRERLGIWAKVGGDSAVSPAAWRRCVDPQSQPGDRVAFAVDVPPTRDMATIAAVSDRGDGVWHVSIVAREEGTAWVPDRLAELKERWSPVAIVLDEGSAAGALLPDIKRARVRTVPLSGRQHAQACGAVFDAVQQRRLAHVGYADLDRAVEAAQMKVMPGSTLWKWARRSQADDISPLIAVTNAWHGLSLKTRRPMDEQRSGRTVGRRPVGRRVVGRG